MENEKENTVIIGPFVSVFGGAEIVKLHVAEFFNKKGWRVVLAGLAENNFVKIQNLFSSDRVRGIEKYYLLKYFPPIFGLYQPLIGFKAVEKAIEKLKPSIVFVDYEGSRRIERLWKKIGFKLIKYIHFPQSIHLFLKKTPERVPAKYFEDLVGYFKKYRSSLFWKVYLSFFVMLLEKMLSENPVECDLLLTNSTYIGELVKSLYGAHPIILYPPVEVDIFEQHAWRSFHERDNAIVMLGRISPEKNYEEVINAVSLTNSKPVVRIIGSLNRPGKTYLDRVVRRAREKRVNLELYPNMPRKILAEILGRSKIFVHATRGEHFGIAVVEAMASGLPVIVHRSGGQYYDIIGQDVYGLSYKKEDELAEHIDLIFSNESVWNKYSQSSKKRARDFSKESFEKMLNSLI